jgi:NAD(P)-dependent dehydrogenase (short-subunit alcohol dehydrogenase family)
MGSNPASGQRIAEGVGGPRMQGKTVLITGANQGIGKASAIALGKLGAKLVLVCRNADKGRAAVADIQQEGARDVELMVGDMGSQADVRRVAGEFKAKHDRLDVLLNNAGVLVTSRRTTVDGIEETFAVNHLGYFLLTHLLLDVLKASGPSRIVSVSSEAHRRGKMRWEDLEWKSGKYSAMAVYSQSKLANILFTRELAHRLAGSRVTANCLHPGVIASGFGHTYGGVFSVVLRVASPFLITPEKGARTSVYLASSPEVEGVSGKYFDKCKPRQPNAEALAEGAPERLWAISETMTGLRAPSAAA